MSLSDPISDMLNRIRNASAAGHKTTDVLHSRLKGDIVAILKREGYIRDFTIEGDGVSKRLCLVLKYDGTRTPTIRGLRRVSRPGLRRYVACDQIPRVLGGMGLAILSTPSGVLSDADARRLRVGGELLCQVW
jgi:small subunit ribosomal protein S8